MALIIRRALYDDITGHYVHEGNIIKFCENNSKTLSKSYRIKHIDMHGLTVKLVGFDGLDVIKDADKINSFIILD